MKFFLIIKLTVLDKFIFNKMLTIILIFTEIFKLLLVHKKGLNKQQTLMFIK